jgi:dihydroorotate dehydrogenase
MRSAMTWTYRSLVRPFLFSQDAERIHNRTMRALSWVSRSSIASNSFRYICGSPDLPVSVFGLRFPNPVGLAAGMDKNAEALPAWSSLGFGFTELGAVTWHPQPGNPAPRVFRAIADEAIVNRMGFNNAGAEKVAEVLANWRKLGRWPQHPVGMNLGKSKITPLDKAAQDYANSLRVLLPHLDFFVVNVSSPNTLNLRQLQDKAQLDEILAALQEVQQEHCGSAGSTGPAKPVLVKIAPDLSLEALDEILELAGPRKIAGIVATNTTISRPQSSNPRFATVYAQAGGLSGRPLRHRSTEIIRHLHEQTRGKLPIIGVGGIFNAADAWEKITAGASLVQVYTGLVYEGPGIARSIVRGLDRQLKKAGLSNLQDVVGSGIG